MPIYLTMFQIPLEKVANEKCAGASGFIEIVVTSGLYSSLRAGVGGKVLIHEQSYK
jgi:hypothetical protein